MAAAVEGGAQLGALYPAVAAVLVALIGLAGTLLARRSRTDATVDTSEKSDARVLVTALEQALDEAAEAKRERDAFRDRAVRCEAREQARLPEQRQESP